MAAVAPQDLSTLDIDALRAMVLQRHVVIERLQTIIAHLRRMQFGRKSEKIDRQVEQLELELEELESETQLGLKSWNASWSPRRQQPLPRPESHVGAHCQIICHVR